MYSTTCGFCGRLSHREVVEQHRIDLQERLSDGVIHEAVGVFRCANCTRYNVGTAQRSEDSPLRASHTVVQPFAERQGSVANDEIVWTPKFIEGATFDDVPPQIANAATEVVKCLSAGYLRAAALLAHSVIEATAKDQGATKGILDRKIDMLSPTASSRSTSRTARMRSASSATRWRTATSSTATTRSTASRSSSPSR